MNYHNAAVRGIAGQGGVGTDHTTAGAHGGGTVDYPPPCAEVGRLVAAAADRGIVIGGSGSGEQIACDKIPGV